MFDLQYVVDIYVLLVTILLCFLPTFNTKPIPRFDASEVHQTTVKKRIEKIALKPAAKGIKNDCIGFVYKLHPLIRQNLSFVIQSKHDSFHDNTPDMTHRVQSTDLKLYLLCRQRLERGTERETHTVIRTAVIINSCLVRFVPYNASHEV